MVGCVILWKFTVVVARASLLRRPRWQPLQSGHLLRPHRRSAHGVPPADPTLARLARRAWEAKPRTAAAAGWRHSPFAADRPSSRAVTKRSDRERCRSQPAECCMRMVALRRRVLQMRWRQMGRRYHTGCHTRAGLRRPGQTAGPRLLPGADSRRMRRRPGWVHRTSRHTRPRRSHPGPSDHCGRPPHWGSRRRRLAPDRSRSLGLPTSASAHAVAPPRAEPSPLCSSSAFPRPARQSSGSTCPIP
mmetsp:Transcript_23205/g.71100  ORF Transcript_23205/g.71100 Transcript_23205/m.71100 type:complete len:246 (+) Transcript_23205:374-1111(+)